MLSFSLILSFSDLPTQPPDQESLAWQSAVAQHLALLGLISFVFMLSDAELSLYSQLFPSLSWWVSIQGMVGDHPWQVSLGVSFGTNVLCYDVSIHIVLLAVKTLSF